MAQVNSHVEFEVLPTPVKFKNDKNEYKVIRLKNGLTACLISDPSRENVGGAESLSEEIMAAACLAIGVGSYSDPKHIPGLAHLVEHMVFLGSEKFPKKRGCQTAITSFEKTIFLSQCLHKNLCVVLDMLSQMFISSLMRKESVNGECVKIQSEFERAQQINSDRRDQLSRSFSTSESPVCFFTRGNFLTLRDNIAEDELHVAINEFRERHYSAHRMTLAIQARLPMDVLQSSVLKYFSDIPTNDLPPDDFKKFKNVFDTPQFKKLYYVESVNDTIEVYLAWALPSLLDKYKKKSFEYVSRILCLDLETSLISYLKKRKWILRIEIMNDLPFEILHNYVYNTMCSLFEMRIFLTKEGLNHLEEIIESVFSYIVLKKEGPHERLYQHFKKFSENDFKLETPIKHVKYLSKAMQIFPPEDYLTGPTLYVEYDPDDIQMVFNSLTPDKMCMIVLCKDLPDGLTFDKTEKWFGTKYTERDISEKWLETWRNTSPKKELLLSSIPFLAENFTILKEDENHPEYPEKILRSNLVDVWYRKDQKFKLPIAYYYFDFISGSILWLSKESLYLYAILLETSLKQKTYLTGVAKLSYELTSAAHGIRLLVSGYNEKLHLLIELIARHIADFNTIVTEEMFNTAKDELVEYYRSKLNSKSLADEFAEDHKFMFTVPFTPKLKLKIKLAPSQDCNYTITRRYRETLSVTYEDVKKVSPDFFKMMFFKVLVQGNVTKERAISVVNNVVAILNCRGLDRDLNGDKNKTNTLQTDLNINLSADCQNTPLINHCPVTHFSAKGSAILKFLALLAKTYALNKKECFTNTSSYGFLHFHIVLFNAEAKNRSRNYIYRRSSKFLGQIFKLLRKMSTEEFEAVKRNLIRKEQYVDKNLKEEVERNWLEICNETYLFHKTKQEITEIGKLTVEDILTWCTNHFPRKSNSKMHGVEIVGLKSGEAINENAQLTCKGVKSKRRTVFTIRVE